MIPIASQLFVCNCAILLKCRALRKEKWAVLFGCQSPDRLKQIQRLMGKRQNWREANSLTWKLSVVLCFGLRHIENINSSRLSTYKSVCMSVSQVESGWNQRSMRRFFKKQRKKTWRNPPEVDLRRQMEIKMVWSKKPFTSFILFLRFDTGISDALAWW